MDVKLTVIVKDTDGQLVSGAKVSVTPGDTTATTGDNGEATVNASGANRYQVTVSTDHATQTVPYYAVQGQSSARLEVNLEYFKQLEQAKTAKTPAATVADTTSWYQTPLVITGGAVVLAIILAIIITAIVRGAKRRKAYKHHFPEHSSHRHGKASSTEIDT